MSKVIFLSVILSISLSGLAMASILQNESEIQSNGYYKVYLSGGGAYTQGNYRDGRREGRFETFDVKSKKRLEVCHYYAGEKHGICKKYYPKTGELKKVVEFFAGVPHGSYKEYFENGRLKQETNYRHGIKIGMEKYFYDNGRLARRIEHKDRKIIQVIEYDRAGKEVAKP